MSRLAFALVLAVAAPANAVYQCGNVKDDCQCGKNNIYPCCDNGGNCTWYAWEMMCCNWGYGPGNWGNANTWASNAASQGHPISGEPIVGAIASSTKGTYGHVAYVVAVNGDTVVVHEENCCGSCNYGWREHSYNKSYFNSGYIMPKGWSPGPVCGQKGCEGGENCANCPQDCGACCGNGACDNGENCSSCPDDCGACCGNGACDFGETCLTCTSDCVCAPEGSLDVASCSSVAGWTSDLDNGGAVEVHVRIDGVDRATLSAGDAYPGHDGHGFHWTVPADVKDGAVRAVTVLAIDNKGLPSTTLGPRSFLCQNDVVANGIWVTTRADGAGIDVGTPASNVLGSTLLHAHPGGYPYPISGTFRSCAALALEPVHELRAHLAWDLAAGRFRSRLTLGEALLRTLEGAGAEDLDATETGTEACLITEALTQADAPQAEQAALSGLVFRSGHWWTAYSADAGGLIVSHGAHGDGFEARARSGAAAGPAIGSMRTWLELDHPFDTVSYHLDVLPSPIAGIRPTVRIGDAAAVDAAAGDRTATGLSATRVELAVGTDAPTPVPADFAARFGSVRVREHTAVADGPWTVERLGSWGLGGGIPPEASDAAVGWTLLFTHELNGWWSTGAVSASMHVTGAPFERVRARYAHSLPDAAFALTVYADKEPAATLGEPGEAKGEFDVPAHGSDLQLVFGLRQDRRLDHSAFFEVTGLEVLREGWWSTATPRSVGLRDDRPEPGMVRLETSRAWAMLGGAISGARIVRRTFAEPQRALQFDYRQDLSSDAVFVVVLLDGVPAQVLDEPGEVATSIQLSSDPFTEVGFALVTRVPGVYPYHWTADVSGIEVSAQDGAWHVAAELAERGPAVAPTDEAPAPPVVTRAPDSSGCAAGGHGGLGGLAVLLALLALLARRRNLPRA